MSSISATERARQTEDVRSARDEYQEKEAELVKKQKKELQRLQKRNAEALESVKASYQDQITGLREKSQEILTKKDVDNQNKIEQVRAMYSEQLKKKSEESATRQESAESTFNAQLQKNQEINEIQKSNLRRNFQDSLKERDRELADVSVRTSEKVQDAISSRAEKLNKKHEVEMQAMMNDRDRSLGGMQKTLSDVKSVSENQFKSEQRKNRGLVDRMNSNFMNTYRNQEYQNSKLMENKEIVLKHARGAMQERYEKAIDKKMSDLDQSREDLEDRVDSRLERDVRAAKSELSKVKNDKAVEDITSKRINDLEKKHLQSAYEERMEALNAEKGMIVEKANEVTHERIDNVLHRTDKLLQDTNRNNRLKMNMLTQRNHEDRDQTIANHKGQLEYLQNRTDGRVRKIMTETDKTMKSQIKNHEESIDQLKNAYFDTLSSQRDKQESQLVETRLRMEERLRENQNIALKKHEATVEQFQVKIEKLENEKKEAVQKVETTLEQKLQAQEKAQRMQLEAENQKTEMKIAQQEEIHQKEIDRLERRHQEQMQSLAKQMAYYKKKA